MITKICIFGWLHKKTNTTKICNWFVCVTPEINTIFGKNGTIVLIDVLLWIISGLASVHDRTRYEVCVINLSQNYKLVIN